MKKIINEGEPRFSLKEKRAIPPYKGPKRALFELMNEVKMQVHHFKKECWNITIELLADHLGLMTNPWKYSLPDIKWGGPISKPSYSQFQQLKEHVQKTGLIEAYIKAAKKEPWDYLGDIFVEEELAGRQNRLGQMLTPKGVVDFMIECVGIGKVREHAFGHPDARTEAWLSVEAMAYDHSLSTTLLLERQRLRRSSETEPVWEKYTVKPQTVLDTL